MYFTKGNEVWFRAADGKEHLLCTATSAEVAERLAANLNGSPS